MLTQQQRDDFAATGLVKLRGAVDPATAEQMCDQVWAFMAQRHGIQRDDPTTWTVEKPSKFQPLTRGRVLEPIASAPIRAALDELMPDWAAPPRWGRPLVTFPTSAGHWEVPTAAWHTDGPPGDNGTDRPAGMTVFVFLAPAQPRGGGTLVLAGSHHLVARAVAGRERVHSRDVEAALAKRHEWLHDLWDKEFHGDRVRRFMHDGATLDGVDVRVVELTGQPGDAYLMRGDSLHAPAPNCLDVPRMMALELLACRQLSNVLASGGTSTA